jgi:hypothetical protein
MLSSSLLFYTWPLIIVRNTPPFPPHSHLVGNFGLRLWMGSCRGSALPRLAQVLYELFGGVDLVLSDIMVAIVLTAAAQQNRRRAYIETKFGKRFTQDEELDGRPLKPKSPLFC